MFQIANRDEDEFSADEVEPTQESEVTSPPNGTVSPGGDGQPALKKQVTVAVT